MQISFMCTFITQNASDHETFLIILLQVVVWLLLKFKPTLFIPPKELIVILNNALLHLHPLFMKHFKFVSVEMAH